MAVKNTQQKSVESRPNTTVPPSDPRKYSITGHFRKRVRQEGRFITEQNARLTIRNGTTKYYEDKGWRFIREVHGVSYVVIVDDIDTSPVIVTGWTEITDEQKARKSIRWSITHIRIIKLRSALSENNGRSNPEKIKPLLLTKPIDIKGHRVVTNEGNESVRCERCNLKAESKCELSTSHCHGWRP